MKWLKEKNKFQVKKKFSDCHWYFFVFVFVLSKNVNRIVIVYVFNCLMFRLRNEYIFFSHSSHSMDEFFFGFIWLILRDIYTVLGLCAYWFSMMMIFLFPGKSFILFGCDNMLLMYFNWRIVIVMRAYWMEALWEYFFWDSLRFRLLLCNVVWFGCDVIWAGWWVLLKHMSIGSDWIVANLWWFFIYIFVHNFDCVLNGK